MWIPIDSQKLEKLATDPHAVGQFLYIAPSKASACALRKALSTLQYVEDVMAYPRAEEEIWVVIALVLSVGQTKSEHRVLAWLKRVASAHRCRFVGWDLVDLLGACPWGDGPPS
jgi:hypothetical protein